MPWVAISSFRLPTARWVFPVPMPPTSSRPVLLLGEYSSTNLQAAMRASLNGRGGRRIQSWIARNARSAWGFGRPRAKSLRVASGGIRSGLRDSLGRRTSIHFHHTSGKLQRLSSFECFFSFQCALRSAFAQVIAGVALCTSCEGEDMVVENAGKLLFHHRDTVPQRRQRLSCKAILIEKLSL